MTTAEIRPIASVDAGDFPPEVEQQFLDNDWSGLHYQNDIIQVEDDGSPFPEWLKSIGYVFTDEDKERGWANIGVFAT
mgnify:CR=1 FL=1